jgi:hypothetical protein
VSSRNGYRREWQSRARCWGLSIPRLRQGNSYPQWLLERYSARPMTILRPPHLTGGSPLPFLSSPGAEGRRHQKRPHQAGLVWPATADQNERRRFLSPGARTYLPSPVSTGERPGCMGVRPHPTWGGSASAETQGTVSRRRRTAVETLATGSGGVPAGAGLAAEDDQGAGGEGGGPGQAEGEVGPQGGVPEGPGRRRTAWDQRRGVRDQIPEPQVGSQSNPRQGSSSSSTPGSCISARVRFSFCRCPLPDGLAPPRRLPGASRPPRGGRGAWPALAARSVPRIPNATAVRSG